MTLRILKTFEKQPGETLDYNILCGDWLADKEGDTIASVDIVLDDGITLDSYDHLNGTVKMWISGGTDGETYHGTITITTAGGRIKEGDFEITVYEV